jgi:hypothetical protein
LIEIFNNQARAPRDEKGVDSYKEPVQMIYQDRYEELLFRDLTNDFRITYASDSLGENLVCTYLSKIYWAFKSSRIEQGDKSEVYPLFELKLKNI